MKKYFFYLGICFASGCVVSVKTNTAINKTAAGGKLPIDGKLFTALYQQRAAEYKALCLQAFNLAALRLNNYASSSTLPKAIVTDIDETVLDNSAYAVQRAKLGLEYDSASWQQWSDQINADTVPGAPAFLKYAATKGVEIFYITNRYEAERKNTLQNLKKFGLPNVDDTHLLLKTTMSGKEPRRQQVASNHEIIMLLGDNLADFSTFFDRKNLEERSNNVDKLAADFGNRFILIPNPNYGDWEGALLNNVRTYSIAQKDSIYRSMLKGY